MHQYMHLLILLEIFLGVIEIVQIVFLCLAVEEFYTVSIGVILIFIPNVGGFFLPSILTRVLIFKFLMNSYFQEHSSIQ